MPSHNGAQVTLLEAPTETGHGTIKIVDFGLAKTQSLGPPTSDVGTPRYKAPEIERGALGDAKPFLWFLMMVVVVCRLPPGLDLRL